MLKFVKFNDLFLKQKLTKPAAYMGLNLSLKGQRIVPKITQKREIKCERTENKSLQNIYTLARLASSSSRVRRSVVGSTGPTIMDFMQCINFKSRLDREREMIRRKIRSSTLYRKPSFTKHSGFNIYSSSVGKNLKLGEFKDDSLRKVPKSPLFLGDEQGDENESEKAILCIGSKYLDVTATGFVKSTSTSTVCLLNNPSDHKQNDADFEKAISQSHLSPSLFGKKTKDLDQETSSAPNTQKVVFNNDDDIKILSSENGETLSPSLNKRKEHIKTIKKSTNVFAVGKYSDAQKTEVALDDLPNSTHQNTKTPSVSKSKKTGTKKKSSTHSKKLETKSNSPKSSATKVSENC